MNKKILSLLLSALMICSLCACDLLPGKQESLEKQNLDALLTDAQIDPIVIPDDKEVVDEDTETENDIDDSKHDEDEEIDDANTPDEDEEIDDDSDDLPIPEDSEFEFGEMRRDYQYVNLFFNIFYEFNEDEDWTFLSEKDRDESNDLICEQYGGNYIEAMKNGVDLIDLMATNTTDSSSVNLTVTDTKLLFLLIDEDEYLEVQADSVIDSFSQLFVFENVEKEIFTKRVAGKECTGIKFSGDLSLDANSAPTTYYEEIVLYKNYLGYSALFQTICFDDDKCDELMEGFSCFEDNL